jgi:hypothetical protein
MGAQKKALHYTCQLAAVLALLTATVSGNNQKPGLTHRNGAFGASHAPL